MLYPTGAQIPFAGQFTAGGAGAAGLTVTVSVVRLNSDGTRAVVISRASNTAATEVDATNQPGLYSYLLAGASTGTAGIYLATLHTAGTADLADVPALEIVGAAWVQAASLDLDATVSSRAAIADYTTARAAKLDNLDATVSSRLATSGYMAPPSAASITAAVWAALTSALTTSGSIGKWIVDKLDVGVSTRAAAGSPITLVSPSSLDGTELTLICGDDYGATPPGLQRFLWTLPAGAYPDLTGGTVALTVAGQTGPQGTGVVVTGSPTGAQQVAVDFTNIQSAAYAALAGSDLAYSLTATTSGGKVQTLIPRGTLRVRARA